MTDPPQLPPLLEGTLDDEGLVRLCADLARATVLEVRHKASPRTHARGVGDPDLRGVVDHLRDGSVRGVQVVYRHEGQLWCDTILRTEAGYRVVRAVVGSSPPRTRA